MLFYRADPGVDGGGSWVDDKGSKTVISHSNNAGVFSGFYLTALTATDNTIRPSPLQGIQHLGHQSIFGFVVKWNFSDENGEEHLKTALLLPAEVGSTAEDWKATSRFRRARVWLTSAAQRSQKASDFAEASDPSGRDPAPPSRGGWGWEEAATWGGGSRCQRSFIRSVPPGAGTCRFLEATMAIGLTALGLLAFLLGCSGTFVEPQNSERTAKCSLTGRWVNERGAKIVISHNINGVFSGVYVAAPSATNKTIPPLMLQGIQHLDPQPTFGFILKSNISASSTVFVGQCFIDENAEEQLETAWLLRRNLPSRAETWKATSVGTDTFKRVKTGSLPLFLRLGGNGEDDPSYFTHETLFSNKMFL
ncbi:avidin-like [Crotalus adamanteus]|uniref:Avidin-like n=1 Tax=Crotalus adamanteus TaxID=8729 RepID=A0AAW1C2X9_CROAD